LLRSTGLPDEIADEQTAGELADFVQKQINAFLKRADAVHHDEKAPFLTASRTVDFFKHSLTDSVETAKIRVNAIRKVWADRKAAAEKIRLEEIERQAREDAREAQRIADEKAEAQRKEEAEAQRIADEAAETERAEARKAQEIADLAAKKLADEEDYEEALAAQKEADRVKAANAAKAKLAQKEADRVKAANTAKARVAQKEADRAEKVAGKATKAAHAKPAQLGKSRGQYGGQTTLKTHWEIADLDRALIDLEALRFHLPIDGIDQAIRSWIDANKDGLVAGATLKGVRIYADTRL